MFTLIRPLSALALALFGFIAAREYAQLYPPGTYFGRFDLWLAGTAAVIGYTFLGARIVRGPLYAVYYTGQAIALTAMVAAMAFALRMVFVFGYRRIYREPMDVVNGFVDHTLKFLTVTADLSFLLFLAGGALAAGIGLHLLHQGMERRRLAR
jgi:hypothetical protein